MVCESGNLITRMCIKPSCNKTSLFCDKKDCPSCQEEHKKCPKIELEAVTDGINKHVSTKKYIVEQVGAIENEFLKLLREASNRLGEEVRFAGLGEESRKIAQKIYDEGNAKCLKGKEAAWFLEQVEEYEERKPSL